MSVSLAKPFRKPIRLRSTVYNAIDREAAFYGEKAGTVANRIVEEELNKIERVGIDHCIVRGSVAYKAISESDRAEENYYIIPDKEAITKQLPSRGVADTSNQVSFYLSQKQMKLLECIVKIQNIVGTIDSDKILTLRYAIVGLMLNNEVLSEIEKM